LNPAFPGFLRENLSGLRNSIDSNPENAKKSMGFVGNEEKIILPDEKEKNDILKQLRSDLEGLVNEIREDSKIRMEKIDEIKVDRNESKRKLKNAYI
jgi:hypothetical protein